MSESHQVSDITIPLAERLRPRSLADFVGQTHVIGPDKWLSKLLQQNHIPSLIFWGPPGVGKTTLAKIIAETTKHRFVTLSAVNSGIKDIKEVTEAAQKLKRAIGQHTVLFIDEIHRFNKSQQDSLLPQVESGILTLIGATTENPSFELNSALLSRCQVVTLNALNEQELKTLLDRACEKQNRPHVLQEPLTDFLIAQSHGDARYMLNILDDVLRTHPTETLNDTHGKITLELAGEKILRRASLYDKKSEHHYNVISAFIKSLRDSDPDAALYYLARMLDSGEDPLFIARRMIIFASEDVGNANPQAVQVAVSCMQSYDFIGRAEGWIPLAQCATYLACSPKSNASYKGYKLALQDVQKFGALEVPLHLRNAPTKLMQSLGYGKNYQYAHDNPDAAQNQQHLPEQIKNHRYYSPTENGFELKIKEWLQKTRATPKSS